MLRSLYPETGEAFSGIPQEKFIQINYYKVKQSEDVELDGVIFAADRVLVPQVPCEDLKLDLSDVNYSPEELKNAKCVEFTSEAKIGGSYENGLLFRHDIEIVPCKIEGTETCEVMIDGVPTNTRDTTGPINEYFRNFVLEISYIQDTADVGSFKKPIVRNLNSEIRLRFDGERQTYINYEFSQLKIETTSGSYKKETTIESGLYFKSSFFNVNPRVSTDETNFFLDGQVAPLERYPYAYVSFRLSNQIQRVERVYPVMIDTMKNIGGVAEVLLFIFIYMMMYHHDIIMDLFMLNNAVLMNHFNVNDKKIRQNQVADLRT